MAKDPTPEDRKASRFRKTLAELEDSVHIPPEKLVTSSALDRRPADADLDREQLDRRWAGGA